MAAVDDAQPETRHATIVGAGPAGLMAAEALADAGFAVTVFEHKRSVGRKFLLAGRGGLNITHSEPIEAFNARYGNAAGHLDPALADFTPSDLRAWCLALGEPTFIGSSGRVFPDSFKATPLLRAWLTRLKSQGVEFRTGQRWLRFNPTSSGCTSIFTDTDDTEVTVSADVTVMALGGASWPRVGSDGGWVTAFRSAGIAIEDLEPANSGVQLRWSARFSEQFEGEPVKNVAIAVGDNVVRGDLTITKRGLEGGPVYAQSSDIRLQLAAGSASLIIDLSPDLSIDQLSRRLDKRRPKSSASTWLRGAGFSPVEIGLLREATDNRLPDTASEVAELAKATPLRLEAMMPIDRAISSAGGVAWAEVDDGLMLHNLPGIFVAGEMLDWEAPTGGYLLQACFSTAVRAAEGARTWVSRRSSETPQIH
ncbi:MAG: NAD(P)/FAD-dependent oxidoreductase [Acidimicrobiales bacterium]|jgi:uncharacterized flavoprotein (TIGR03862 family)